MLFPVEIHSNEVVLMNLRDRYVRKRVTLDYLRNVLIPNSSFAQCCVFKMLLPRLEALSKLGQTL